MTDAERAAWGASLRVGSVVAVRSLPYAAFVPPWTLHQVTKANRRTIALHGVHGLVARDFFFLQPVTGDIRRAIAIYHLNAWSLHSAADQISKLTPGQQAALKHLVSRMAADPLLTH